MQEFKKCLINAPVDEIIKTSKAYCPLAWCHLHVSAIGNAMPCCVSKWHSPYGNINENSFDEIWNNENIRNFRKNMLLDKKSAACADCYSKEKSDSWSLRIESIKKYHDMVRHWIDTTDDETGYSKDSFPLYWDIRFSNICNMRCRMCGHFSSSKWFNDAKVLSNEYNLPGYWTNEHKKQAIIRGVEDSTSLLNRLEEYLPYTKEIYFAGGEPLLMDEHYRILEYLDKTGQHDIYLRYGTNLMVLDYKKTSVTELWKKFKNVEVFASIDAIADRAEIIRKDTNWGVIENNAYKIKNECPDIKFKISPTVQILNVLTVCDLHLDWIEKGLIGPNDCFYNILENPSFYNIRALPAHLKLQATQIWNNYIDNLKSRYDESEIEMTVSSAKDVIKFMLKKDLDESNIDELIRHTIAIDKIRDEDTFFVFPELNSIWYKNEK